MKNIQSKMWLGAAAILFGLAGCVPESEDYELGPVPTAAFTMEPISGKTNTYLLTSTGEDGFVFFWNKGSGTFRQGTSQDTLYLPWPGDYEIGLRVVASGGVAEVSDELTIDEADPEACSGNLPILTDCSSKTWVLKQPEGGALTIGPPNLESVWWSIPTGDVTAPDRVCLFDNEYTFTAQGGVFEFNNSGTFRVDDEASAPWPTDIGLDIGCYAMEDIPEKYQAWGSGTHKFELAGDELTLIGLGAHVGLYKAGQAGTIAAPEESNTYQIFSISENEIVLRKNYDWGTWQFILIPKE